MQNETKQNRTERRAAEKPTPSSGAPGWDEELALAASPDTGPPFTHQGTKGPKEQRPGKAAQVGSGPAGAGQGPKSNTRGLRPQPGCRATVGLGFPLSTSGNGQGLSGSGAGSRLTPTRPHFPEGRRTLKGDGEGGGSDNKGEDSNFANGAADTSPLQSCPVAPPRQAPQNWGRHLRTKTAAHGTDPGPRRGAGQCAPGPVGNPIPRRSSRVSGQHEGQEAARAEPWGLGGCGEEVVDETPPARPHRAAAGAADLTTTLFGKQALLVPSHSTEGKQLSSGRRPPSFVYFPSIFMPVFMLFAITATRDAHQACSGPCTAASGRNIFAEAAVKLPGFLRGSLSGPAAHRRPDKPRSP